MVAGGAGPGVGPVVESFVVPRGMGFGAVVGAAQGCEVAGAGLAWWSAVFDGEVGGDVVEVAGSGVAAAAGEDAVGVAEQDGLSHRVGWVVLVDRGLGGRVGGEVEDGPDGDLAAGVGVG